MEDNRIYHIRISPEVIKNDIFKVNYIQGNTDPEIILDECCDITTVTTTVQITGSAYVYSSMTQILSGGTNGTSLLTGLTIPFFLTQTCVDIGYYSVFDGMILQKDVMTNFVFSASTGLSNNTYFFYNTSDVEFKKYLQFSEYKVDWGDGFTDTITSTAPNFYSHTYLPPTTGQTSYTISMSGLSPWGWNVVKKKVYIPFTGMTINNPKGKATFHPMGGNWSATSFSYDYIYPYDSECILPDPYYDDFGKKIPFLITGYTKSTVNDLQVYGNKKALFAGKFLKGVPITGSSGFYGTYFGPMPDGLSTGYTINDINYYDYSDGTTLFVVKSSGLTFDDVVCSAITKNEAFLNVIDQPQIQSNIYIERGKNSGYESTQRIGEINSMGSLEKYGYKFFKVIKT